MRRFLRFFQLPPPCIICIICIALLQRQHRIGDPTWPRWSRSVRSPPPSHARPAGRVSSSGSPRGINWRGPTARSRMRRPPSAAVLARGDAVLADSTSSATRSTPARRRCSPSSARPRALYGELVKFLTRDPTGGVAGSGTNPSLDKERVRASLRAEAPQEVSRLDKQRGELNQRVQELAGKSTAAQEELGKAQQQQAQALQQLAPMRQRYEGFRRTYETAASNVKC